MLLTLKALTSAPKLQCRSTILEEHLLMTASALKYDHDIIIIKSAESLKLFSYEEIVGRSIEKKIANIIMEKAFKVFQCIEKSFPCFFFSTLFHSIF